LPRIRALAINHFRGIKELLWFPRPGFNCLIGPGDSSKSTVLDAIDMCLGARRSLSVTDADFHRLETSTPISIEVTLGALDDRLKSLDAYGNYLRGFNASTRVIEDEPGQGLEPVLTVRLSIAADLEPSWTLASERAEAGANPRLLGWADRVRIAPARIGVLADYHLAWGRGSVLTRLSDERPDASAHLAAAMRGARAAFGESAQGQLSGALQTVTTVASELGVPVGTARALLDMHALPLGSGAISLHDAGGVPLRNLGVGSSRLLSAGLQHKAAAGSHILLLDELEYGLEPHRVVRLLGSLGAKETSPTLQVFATTHSPAAVRELSGDQLSVVRRSATAHEVTLVGSDDSIQSTTRLYPEALLSAAVIACEGASEVGLLRGLDLYLSGYSYPSLHARGVAVVDCGGGEADRPYNRATAFLRLGYRAAVLRDADTSPTQGIEAATRALGGFVVTWRAPRALEDELFLSLSPIAVAHLVERAVELHGDGLVNDHIKSASSNQLSLAMTRTEFSVTQAFAPGTRAILGVASKAKRSGWFKSVTWMEGVARDIVGPDLSNCDPGFSAIVTGIMGWPQNVSA
jgi:putative ATP-dependent endonuclease of the OLD family